MVTSPQASDIITFGLSIIFMRGGLELDLNLVRKVYNRDRTQATALLRT